MLERRRFVRLEKELKIKYELRGEKKLVGETTCRNIGGGGLCIYLDKKIEEDEKLNLEIKIPRLPGAIFIQGKVIWSEEVLSEEKNIKRFETGINFIEIQTQDREKIIDFVYENIRELRRKYGKFSSRDYEPL